MRRLFAIGACAFAGSLAVGTFIACSSSDSVGGFGLDASDDGNPNHPVDGGGDATAVNDAAVDADGAVDTCTVDGWCHIVVPDKQTLMGIWGDATTGAIFTISQQGNVLRWDGTTKGWTQSYSAGAALYTIWGSSPTDLWAGGVNGLYHGTGASPDALTWTVVATPAAVTSVYSIWGSGANDVYAVGDINTMPQGNPDTPDSVLHYNGTKWSVDPISTGATSTYYLSVWGTGPTDVWLVGAVDSPDPAIGSYLARLLHRQTLADGGTSWKDIGGPDAGGYLTPTYLGASISADDVYLLGIQDTQLFYSTYSGARSTSDASVYSWSQQDPDPVVLTFPQIQDYAVWGTGPKDVWKGGQLGRLRHWDGTNWVIARIAIDNAVPVQNTIYGIWGKSSTDVWVVGDNLALHKGAP